MPFLIRFGPALAVVLAPFLLRVPAWAAGISLSPFWQAAMLTGASKAPFAPGLPGYMDLEAGWTTQALGIQAAQQWLSGRVPWWDSYSGVGLPLAAEMQSSALFLPYILLMALPGGAVLMTIALQITGGASALALMRRLGLSRLAATTGALLFELGASFTWIGAPCGLPIAFLPLFLLGLERARAASLAALPATGPKRARTGYRTIAIAVAMSLYAGFPETAYLDGLLALGWAILRLANLPRAARTGFAIRVGSGGLIGLAIATPLLSSFTHLLSQAELGARDGMDMGLLSIPEPGNALYMLPYILGPVAGFPHLDPTGWLSVLWGRIGGYLGFPLAIGALMGLAGSRRSEPALRWFLGGWILACFVRTAAIPGLKSLWLVVPFIKEIQFFRYSGGTWMFAACLLCAFALDDRRLNLTRREWQWASARAWGGTAALVLATGSALWAGRDLLERISATAGPVKPFFWGSIAWGGLMALGAAIAWSRRGNARPLAAAALLWLDVSVTFAIPTLSGARAPQLDHETVEFLQRNLGLQRFYTLGPFQPNYAGVFGLASVNHNYLPIPRWWPEYVKANLDPDADPVLFLGNYPPDVPGRPGRADAVRSNLRAFAETGVRYVLVDANAGLVESIVPLGNRTGNATPLVLRAGSTVTIHSPPGTVSVAGKVQAVALGLGTYGGTATGSIGGQLCRATRCSTGELRLADVNDGADGRLMLDSPLDVAPGDALELVLHRSSGGNVVLWLWSGNTGWSAQDGPASTRDMAPRMSLLYPVPSAGLTLAHKSDGISIYDVAAPASYFDVSNPACRVAIVDREHLRSDCPTPARLIRRELWFPGWEVRIDGRAAPVDREGPIFQAVNLPAGAAEVRFSYRPPFYLPSAVVFVIGLLALAPAGWRRDRPTTA